MSDPFALAAEVRAEGYRCEWAALELREDLPHNRMRAELLVTPIGGAFGASLAAGDAREWVPAGEAIGAIRAELVRVHILPGAGPGMDPWGRSRP